MMLMMVRSRQSGVEIIIWTKRSGQSIFPSGTQSMVVARISSMLVAIKSILIHYTWLWMAALHKMDRPRSMFLLNEVCEWFVIVIFLLVNGKV